MTLRKDRMPFYEFCIKDIAKLYTDWYTRGKGGEKLDNRENIMACALTLFADKGYDAVGVQEIVETAGITKPTMYYYFKSKQGLLEVLLQERGEILMRKLTEASHSIGDISHKLLQLARVYVEFAVADRKFFILMLSLTYYPKQNDAHKAVVPLITKQYHLLTETFKREEPNLGNMRGRQEQFAASFLGTLDSYITVQYEKGNGEAEILDSRAVYGVVHQFLHGIYS